MPISISASRLSRLCFSSCTCFDISVKVINGLISEYGRPFDKNLLSITCYLESDAPNLPRVLCRWMDAQLNPRYSCYSVNELCIRRKGASLQLKRWSEHQEHPTCWTALFFKTWESNEALPCLLRLTSKLTSFLRNGSLPLHICGIKSSLSIHPYHASRRF